MNQERLDELKRLAEGATPEPWEWSKKTFRLMTPKNGQCIVMDFVRRGMQGAQPRFSDRGNAPLGGIMHNASEIDIDKNPDAAFIAAARSAVPELVAEVERLQVEINLQDVLIRNLIVTVETLRQPPIVHGVS